MLKAVADMVVCVSCKACKASRMMTKEACVHCVTLRLPVARTPITAFHRPSPSSSCRCSASGRSPQPVTWIAASSALSVSRAMSSAGSSHHAICRKQGPKSLECTRLPRPDDPLAESYHMTALYKSQPAWLGQELAQSICDMLAWSRPILESEYDWSVKGFHRMRI